MGDVPGMLVPPLHTSSPSKLPVLPEKEKLQGCNFTALQNWAEDFFSGCENANKGKPLCNIPASIAFVIPQRHLSGKIPETLAVLLHHIAID